jgi:hypothetical protein
MLVHPRVNRGLGPVRVWSVALIVLSGLAACGDMDGRGVVVIDPARGPIQLTTVASAPLPATARRPTSSTQSGWATQPPSPFPLVPVAATDVPDRVWRMPATLSAVRDDWETYRSERGGFSLDYPAAWAVEERVDARGALVTMLMPASGAGISVVVESGPSAETGSPDLMNTRCYERTVGGRPARTCLDTISFSLSTTVIGQGKTYIITSTRKRGDQRIYDRVLTSFRILP